MSNEFWIVQIYHRSSPLSNGRNKFLHERDASMYPVEELRNTFYFRSQEEAIGFRDEFMKEAAMRGKQRHWRVCYSLLAEFKPPPSFVKNTFDWMYGKTDPIKELLLSANGSKEKSNG